MPIQNNPVSLGKVTVASAGTPVNVLVNYASDPDFDKFHANKVEIRALFSNATPVYVGYQGMNKTTLENVIAVLPPNAVYALVEQNALNIINVSAFYVDADTSGDGVLVTAHIR